MPRGKADRAYQPPAPTGQYRVPQNAAQYLGHPAPPTNHYEFDHASRSRQGECSDVLAQDRINIYKTVDSWRSYRNDAVTLQTSTDPQRYQPTYYGVNMPASQPQPVSQSGLRELNPDASSFYNSHSQGSHYTPYQTLRSVHHYARYPTYRVDKPYRTSDGTRERQIVQQAQHTLGQTGPQATSRYPFRHRRVDQIAPYSTRALADIPLPSIEGDAASSASVPPETLPTRKVVSRRSRTRTATPESVESPPPPTASADYKRKAALPPERRNTPQKLLVVLDLNGTLLVRPNRRKDPTKFKLRPGVTQLLDYLFENHVVMVYTSARPENTLPIVTNLIHPKQRELMAGVWARDKLDLSKAQYNSKVQVYKKLHKIWADRAIQAKAEPGRKWDQSNTILVDDSHLKALAQPHNLLQVPEFENNAPKEGGVALRDWQLKEQAILKSLEQKLEELKWQVDVSRLIRDWQTGKQHAPGVVDETIDQKTHRSIQQQEREPLSPTPSVGQPDTPQRYWQSPSQSARTETAATEIDASPGGGAAVHGKSVLDTLEEELDRSLHLDNLAQSGGPRSESPIDENVWKEILSGANKGDKNDKQKQKGSLGDVPPTPESMRA